MSAAAMRFAWKTVIANRSVTCPRRTASWLAPLIDGGRIYLDGYVPQSRSEAGVSPGRCPLVLSVFQREKGRGLLEKAVPRNELEALHQTVLQAYQNAQSYQTPELVLALAAELQSLAERPLLPETRLLLALLPRIAHEIRVSQGMRAVVKFRELLGALTIAEPSRHRGLTLFPLLWPELYEPSYTLVGEAIENGLAVVEVTDESDHVSKLAVTNKATRPLLIPAGKVLAAAKQIRVINITVLVAPGGAVHPPNRWRRGGPSPRPVQVRGERETPGAARRRGRRAGRLQTADSRSGPVRFSGDAQNALGPLGGRQLP